MCHDPDAVSARISRIFERTDLRMTDPQPNSPDWATAQSELVQPKASGPERPSLKRASQRRMWVAVGVAVLAIAAAATIGTVVGRSTATSQADAHYIPLLESAQSSASSLAASVSSLEAAAASSSAEAAAVPDLMALANEYFDPQADVSGTSTAVTVIVTDSNIYRDGGALANYLTALGFSDAVLDRLSNTRALDGTLTAQGRNCNVSWTYHPDHGLRMVFEARPN